MVLFLYTVICIHILFAETDRTCGDLLNTKFPSLFWVLKALLLLEILPIIGVICIGGVLLVP